MDLFAEVSDVWTDSWQLLCEKLISGVSTQEFPQRSREYYQLAVEQGRLRIEGRKVHRMRCVSVPAFSIPPFLPHNCT